jgi:dTDP-4-amino-4,6-dideoxygalactose transaminase
VSAAEIPFIDLAAQQRRLGGAVQQAVLAVMEHGQYVMGPEVAELEHALAERAGVRHAVSCSSGTDALVLPLMAWAIGPGDAVVVPTFTFAASAESVALVGATPVFADVLPGTFNLDPESARAAVKSAREAGLRPRALMPVDLFGQPVDVDACQELADQEGLLVLADAAQSFGGSWKGRPVGSLGSATATSFFPAKPLGCYGDGGAVFTDDDELAGVLRSVRVHGQGADKYENVRVGMNARIDTMQAAVLLQKLTVFDDEVAQRQVVADRYTARLQDAAGTPVVLDGAVSAWAQYTLLVDDRASVVRRLSEQGVPTAVYYPRTLGSQPPYAASPTAPGGTPVADALTSRVLSLPMHPYLDEATQDRVIDAVRSALAA